MIKNQADVPLGDFPTYEEDEIELQHFRTRLELRGKPSKFCCFEALGVKVSEWVMNKSFTKEEYYLIVYFYNLCWERMERSPTGFKEKGKLFRFLIKYPLTAFQTDPKVFRKILTMYNSNVEEKILYSPRILNSERFSQRYSEINLRITRRELKRCTYHVNFIGVGYRDKGNSRLSSAEDGRLSILDEIRDHFNQREERRLTHEEKLRAKTFNLDPGRMVFHQQRRLRKFKREVFSLTI